MIEEKKGEPELYLSSIIAISGKMGYFVLIDNRLCGPKVEMHVLYTIRGCANSITALGRPDHPLKQHA
jgi:hypothetical protein